METTFSQENLGQLKNKVHSKAQVVKQFYWLPYMMVLPAFVILAVFLIYPIFYMAYLSFFEWNMIGELKYVGFNNFVKLFNNADFYQVFWNSMYYMFFTVIISIFISVLLAVYLRKNTRINEFLLSFAFAPYIVSLVSVSFIWTWLMDVDYGLLNYLIGRLGFGPVAWLDDPKIALFSLVIVSVWKSIGYNTVIINSALQTIPNYLYEAAELDEAKPITVFFKITLKMLSPTLFFLTLMNIIASFKVFETIAIMTQGGPQNSTNTFVYTIYEYGFKYYKIGYASAIGMILLIIISLLTVIYFKMLNKRVHYR